MEKYIMTIDEGTTSVRAVVFDQSGDIISVSQNEFNQYYPKPGWLEQNPIEIWTTTLEVMRLAIKKSTLPLGTVYFVPCFSGVSDQGYG